MWEDITIVDIIGIIISFLSLVFAGYTYYQHSKFRKRQKELNEQQKGLNDQQKLINENVIKKQKEEECEATKANLHVECIKSTSGECAIRIHNKGKACAKNVRLSCTCADEMYPIEPKSLSWDSFASDDTKYAIFKSRAFEDVGNGFLENLLYTPHKCYIMVLWDDDFQKKNVKYELLEMITIPDKNKI